MSSVNPQIAASLNRGGVIPSNMSAMQQQQQQQYQAQQQYQQQQLQQLEIDQKKVSNKGQ